MAKLKQYLENSWYRGASQDRQTGYAAQYQYGYGVNTRDMKNGVCLAGGKTEVRTIGEDFSYFTNSGNLYKVDGDGRIIDKNGVTKCTLPITNEDAPIGTSFSGKIYILTLAKIFQVNPSTWTYTEVTPSVTPDTPSGYGPCFCCLNYANTFLLMGNTNELLKMSVESGTPKFKVVRTFEISSIIYGLTQEGNYLKIYTSNGQDTKIHYAKGTFDVEYTGLVQTVTFNSMRLDIGCVTSDQGNDYVLFRTSKGDGYGQNIDYKLAKISGYNKIDIRWTQTRDGNRIFTGSNPRIYACDGILCVTMDDGIWTFTEYNGWLWGGCCEFPLSSTEKAHDMIRYDDKLYVVLYDGGFKEVYYDLSFHPHTYQPSGFIIGRVFDGGCAGLFKKNDQATITYNMPEGTSMELSYRYDRDSFGYDKSNFLSIKKLTDVNNCYDIVVPTTPGTKDTNLLALENNGNILLENGNNIMLEDLMVCPFNKTWNLLEYRFDFTGNGDPANNIPTTKTPILFEHSLTYYDYMRKYR